MTEKQTSFITRLAQEKDLTGLSAVQSAYVAGLVDGTVAEPNTQQASRIIDALLALPSLSDAKTPTSVIQADVNVPEGRYAIVGDDGAIRFYKVDRPTEGKWAGWTFVKVQASDDEFPVKSRDAKAAILAEIAKDPQAAMIRYGHELGTCGRCGRTLTDETSREMGIGPECAQILGIDRTPYTERARREAAARLTSEGPEEDGPSTTATLDPEPQDDGGSGSVAPSSEIAEAAAQAAETATRIDEAESYSLVRAAAAARSKSRGDGRTWRERKAAVEEQQGRTSLPKRTTSSQMTELPGTEWEHIFGMEVGA